MDESLQIGPDKGDYAADLREVALKLAGATVYVPLTDRGTKLNMVLTLRADLAVVGKGPEGVPIDPKKHRGVQTGGYVHVAITGYGAYWFALGGYLDPSYVATSLDITRADAETVCEFLVRLDAELTERTAA